MPYNSRPYKPSESPYRSQTKPRYVRDRLGIIRGIEGELIDLHPLLTGNSLSVDLMKVTTKEMRPSGLFLNQLSLIDSSLTPISGDIVAVVYNNILVVRKLVKRETGWFLIGDDPRDPEYQIDKEMGIDRIGVITTSIIRYRRNSNGF